MFINAKQFIKISVGSLYVLLSVNSHHIYCVENNDLDTLTQLLNLPPKALNGLTEAEVQRQIRERFTKPNIAKLQEAGTDREDTTITNKQKEILGLFDAIFGGRSSGPDDQVEIPTQNDKFRVKRHGEMVLEAHNIQLEAHTLVNDDNKIDSTLMSESIELFDSTTLNFGKTIILADTYFRNSPIPLTTTRTIVTNISTFRDAIKEAFLALVKNPTIDYKYIMQLDNNIKLLKNYTSNLSQQLEPAFQISQEDKKLFDSIMKQLKETITTLCDWAKKHAQKFEAAYKQQNMQAPSRPSVTPTQADEPKKSKNPFKRLFGK